MRIIKVLLTLCVIMFIYGCSEENSSLEQQTINDESLDQRHRSNSLEFDPCGNLGITVSVCQCDDEDQETTEAQVQAAFNEFNTLGLKLKLRILDCDDQDDADIRLWCGAEGSGNCLTGLTQVDSDGVTVVTTVPDPVGDFEDCCPGQNLTSAEADCFLQGLIMHEMMHAIGFDHTDNTNATLITGSLEDDPDSIVNEGDCDDPQCEFSEGDIEALEILYGPCSCNNTPPSNWLSIRGPATLCDGEMGTFCVTGRGPSSDWTTTMTANGVSTVLGPDNCQEISFASPGLYTISISACHKDFPDCCTTSSLEFRVLPKEGECFCICEAQEQTSYVGFRESRDRRNQIEEWKFPVDCCDQRPCSEIIPEWWDEYLIDDRECFKKEDNCTPPSVGLEVPDDLCVRRPAEFCITGSFNSSTTWSSNRGTLSYSSSKCNNFTAYESGPYTITVVVCDLADGEGQEECCVTLTEDFYVDNCEEECYCRCKDGQFGSDGQIIELVYPCEDDDLGDCYDIHYEDNIYDCVKLRR